MTTQRHAKKGIARVLRERDRRAAAVAELRDDLKRVRTPHGRQLIQQEIDALEKLR